MPKTNRRRSARYRLAHLNMAGNAVRPSRRPASASSFTRPDDGPLASETGTNDGADERAVIPVTMHNPYLQYDPSQPNGYRHSKTRIYARGAPADVATGKRGDRVSRGKRGAKKRPDTASRKRGARKSTAASGAAWEPPTA